MVADPDGVARSRLARRAPEPLPITVLTGFLGAGKTTLLNRLVNEPELSGAVVIVNEFGDVAIDHLLVEKAEGGLLTLASGCICCTVRGDLVAVLEDLLRRRDNARMAPFDRVVIETTGLADPAPVLNAIVFHPYLTLRYRIDGVVTLVDALHAAVTLDAHDEAVRQVAVADCLVLTKADLCPDGAVPAALTGRLSDLNSLADQVGAADATAATLLGASLFRHAGRVAARTDEVDHHHHGHHDHADHDHAHHDHGPHDDRIASFVLTAETPMTAAALDMFLDLLRAGHGPALLRLKGLAALTDDPGRPLLVQGVQHYLHPPRRLPDWPDADRGTRLVVIGRDLDRVVVERLWTAFGPPAVDRPDAAALAEHLAPGLF